MIIRNEKDVTEAVLAELERAGDPRFREIMSAAVRHLHALVRDVKLTKPNSSSVRGQGLVQNAVATGAPRSTASAIEAYIDSLIKSARTGSRKALAGSALR